MDEESHNYLLSTLKNKIPEGWTEYAHHMTINMGPIDKGPLKFLGKKFLGKKVKFKATDVAIDNLVMAVKVETKIPSVNTLKHITIAVNKSGGGKPVMSNKLTDWYRMIPTLTLSGIIEEVHKT